MKASVFPDPVGAWITTSRPSRSGGIASTWTVTGVSIELRASALSKRALTPRSANVAVKRILLGPLYLSFNGRDLQDTVLRRGGEPRAGDLLSLEVAHQCTSFSGDINTAPHLTVPQTGLAKQRTSPNRCRFGLCDARFREARVLV